MRLFTNTVHLNLMYILIWSISQIEEANFSESNKKFIYVPFFLFLEH
jgi:hypothetical protein